MTSKALRRRLHHGDLNEKRRDYYEDSSLEGLSEPLLGNHDLGERHSEVGICGCRYYFCLF